MKRQLAGEADDKEKLATPPPAPGRYVSRRAKRQQLEPETVDPAPLPSLVLPTPTWEENLAPKENQFSTQLKCSLDGHTNGVNKVAWSGGNFHLLASCSMDKTVRLWNISQGSELSCLSHHTEAVKDIAWNFDGSQLLSGGFDQTVQEIDIGTGIALHVCWYCTCLILRRNTSTNSLLQRSSIILFFPTYSSVVLLVMESFVGTTESKRLSDNMQ